MMIVPPKKTTTTKPTTQPRASRARVTRAALAALGIGILLPAGALAASAATPAGGAADVATPTPTTPATPEPAGTVTVSVRTSAGRAIHAKYVTFILDGCVITPVHEPARGDFASSECEAATSVRTGSASLEVTPGKHTIRVVVASPSSEKVRSSVRNLTAAVGEVTDLGATSLRADPVVRARIVTADFLRGHATTVRVRTSTYTDGSSPRMRTSLRVDGKKLPDRYRIPRTSKTPNTVVRFRVPAADTAGRTLRARAIVHATDNHAGTTSPVTVLHGALPSR